jgi:hypothetical protein
MSILKELLYKFPIIIVLFDIDNIEIVPKKHSFWLNLEIIKKRKYNKIYKHKQFILTQYK